MRVEGVPETYDDVTALYVRELRLNNDQTQAGLAAALGISQAHLSRVEKGEKPLTILQLRRVAQYFRMTPGAFIRRVDRRAKRRGLKE